MAGTSNKITKHISENLFRYLIFGALVCSVVLITIVFPLVGMVAGFAVVLLPFVLIAIGSIFRNPYWGIIILFVVNYFLILFFRYSGIDGLSVIVDSIMLLILVIFLFHPLLNQKISMPSLNNGLIYATLIWALYCIFEVVNPTADINAWYLSRALIIYFFFVALLVFLIFNKSKYLHTMMAILSVFTLIGVAKGLMQQFYGFDYGEMAFLDAGSYRTHLLNTGTRYFSIYAGAGIFGAIMGHALVVFFIYAFYVDTKWKRIYYFLVAGAGLYGLMISGTRGALAVPFAGMFLFAMLSKKIKIIVPMIILIAGAYFFLAHTYLAHGNSFVRRMRTAFDINEPSLVVRRENQKLFADYLKDRPFGEGLGLSGVEAQSLSLRFTTTIPTDSWYVKIWVETGVVGLTLYLLFWAYLMAHGSYIVLFQIRDPLLKGTLTALLCGVFGLLVTSYGNLVLGQYPVAIIVYMSMAFVFMGKYLDKQIAEQKKIDFKKP